MADLYSDRYRLDCVCFDDCPPDIDLVDLQKATSMGAPVGNMPLQLMDKFDLNPIEPIKRVCEALTNHAKALSVLKADGEGAPTRHKKAVPASVISFLAWEMLVRCNNSGVLPPVELLKLVRLQLEIRHRQKSDEEEELGWKMCDAARFAFNNPNSSFRDIAELYDVNVSTVSRWNKERNLREWGEMLQNMVDQFDRQAREIAKAVREGNPFR